MASSLQQELDVREMIGMRRVQGDVEGDEVDDWREGGGVQLRQLGQCRDLRGIGRTFGMDTSRMGCKTTGSRTLLWFCL